MFAQDGSNSSGPRVVLAGGFVYDPCPYQLLADASLAQCAVPSASIIPTASISFHPGSPGTPMYSFTARTRGVAPAGTFTARRETPFAAVLDVGSTPAHASSSLPSSLTSVARVTAPGRYDSYTSMYAGAIASS
jgi:hypothetical protein